MIDKMHPAEAFQEVNQVDGEVLDIELEATLLVETFGLGKRFRSNFIGMDRGKYIIARLPQNLDVRKFLQPDMELTIRYLHSGGKIFGFRCRILSIESRLYSLFFLSYPKTLEVLSLRKHERVDCFLPASLFHSSDEFSGIIVNISAGGLRIILDSQMNHAANIKEHSTVLCKFKPFFAEDETSIQGQVRSVEKDLPKIAFGIQFNTASEDIHKSIQDYVINIKEFFDGSPRNAP